MHKDGWHYALLLIVLFAIAALATQAAINYIVPIIGENQRIVVTTILCALTMSLMLISGAFALWAINIESTSASSRRLGDIVSSMTYIKDGVVAVNSKGITTGMNQAAIELLNSSPDKQHSIRKLCPELSDEDIELLMKSKYPEEVEREQTHSGITRTLRFRSQPSKNMTLILINDVTKLAEIRAHRRSAAYLQLIGHISQGLANDFNNILCGIAGHASLIMHPGSDKTIIQQSAKAIDIGANRGIKLAGSLLELSAPQQITQSATIRPADNVNFAVDSVAADLHASWTLTRDINEDVPPTKLTGIQIEHIIHGIGMLSADIYNKDRNLFIQLSQPTEAGLCHTKGEFAGIVIITPSDINSLDVHSLKSRDPGSEGTIESVVSSILKQSGGQMDCFSTPSGIPLYRICMPHASTEQLRTQQDTLPLGLEAYIANWNLLLCEGRHSRKTIQNYMKSCKVNVEHNSSIVDTLARIEHGDDLHAIIINSSILGEEREGLLRAITKLCPQAGLVIIDKNKEPVPSPTSDIVFVPQSYSPAQIAQAMIEARTLARSRKKS